MKFYTKEWYELMQHQNNASGLQVVPDQEYSDREIQEIYDADLNAEIAHDRELHNTPPDYSWVESLLQPDRFSPENFLLMDEQSEEMFHPQTPDIARTYLDRQRKREEEAFSRRPPFDPSETIACFRACYRNMLRYGTAQYPQWVQDSVDKRLLALHRIPETAYRRLQREDRANRRAFEKIASEAALVLEQQDIPKEIREQFCFHDARVLAIKKVGSNVELYLRKDGGWPGDCMPYIKIVFQNVSKMDREKGFALRLQTDAEGELETSCCYLYDELYKSEDGYQVHMLLWTRKALRYLTICCENIHFQDNMDSGIVRNTLLEGRA